MLLWRDEMSVGNAVIDSDHHYLLHLVNSVEMACQTRQPAATLRVILQRLAQYADLHFAREERIQLAMGYALRSEHELSHTNLREYLNDLCVEFESLAAGSASTAGFESLAAWARDWLVAHLLTEDLAMKPHFARLPATFAG
jgi:hemerythrin